jgi:hypothetical protein
MTRRSGTPHAANVAALATIPDLATRLRRFRITAASLRAHRGLRQLCG